jgi:hypothetical protein
LYSYKIRHWKPFLNQATAVHTPFKQLLHALTPGDTVVEDNRPDAGLPVKPTNVVFEDYRPQGRMVDRADQKGGRPSRIRELYLGATAQQDGEIPGHVTIRATGKDDAERVTGHIDAKRCQRHLGKADDAGRVTPYSL